MKAPRAKEANRSKEPAEMFRLEDFLPYRLAVASSQVSRLFTRSYAENFGLTIPEWRVLAIVGRHETLSPSAVGELTAMDKVKVSRAAASLVSRGLLKQSQDPSDGRGRLLRLTRKGSSLHDKVVPEARALEQALAEGLSRAEWQALSKALAKLNAHAEAMSDGEDDEPMD
jgi:DNA-binding MarR family transcriptional regulator